MLGSRLRGFGLVSLASLAFCTARCEVLEDSHFGGPKTTIRYAIWGGPDEIAQTRKFGQQFIKIHPEIRLDIGVYPWGQYWAKIQTQMASGLAPDVMAFYSGSFGVWVARGALLPLDEWVQRSSYSLDDYFPVTISNCRWDGHLFALPTDIAGWSVVYSKDLLEQSGIPEEEWPRTDQAMSWSDFRTLSQRLTLRGSDGSFAQYGMTAGQNWDLTMAGKDGADFVDRPVNPTKSAVAGNTTLERSLDDLFEAQYGLRDTLGNKPLSAGAFAASTDTILLNQKFAMGTTGPWALKQLRDAGIHFGVTPVPRGKVDHALINVNSLAICSVTKHPREAFELLAFLTSVDAAKERGGTLAGIPPRKSAVDAFVHNQLGIQGCEAFVHDLSVATPTLTASATSITTVRDNWMTATEEVLDAEYDRRAGALPRPISASTYQSFTEQMNRFVEKTVHERLPQLNLDLNGAIAATHSQPPSGLVRFILPLFAVLGMVGLGVTYLRSIARDRSEDSEAASKKESKSGIFFLSPWLFGLCCFVLGPIIAAIFLSFTNWNMISLPQWVGFQHYLELASDAKFLIGLKTTFTYAAIVIPISLCGGLFTAGLLSSGIKGADVFKALIYFPALFTGAETAVLWTNMLNKEHGILNYVLSWLHISGPDWMDSSHAFYSVVLMNVFWVGGAMIVYYAGMKQIPQTLYEAAELDGASSWRKFRSVTIPMLSPVILFMVVMTTIGSFQVFTPALFFANSSTDIGSPGDSLRFYAVNIYDKAFNNLQMGEACCYAIILFVIIFAITYGQFRLAKRFVFTEGGS